MSEVIHHYINGRVVEGASGRRGDVFNPAIGEVIRQVSLADAAEVDKVVAAARDAFPAWAAAPPNRRARAMFKMKQLLEENIDALARLMTEEHGKTVEDSKGSITR
ncbi:MAG: aldehyde dehydrogenase family protein, partial [Proteobacteria bacterium]|nr:aldehyde dehydrogenase family protein [Pseudomonadota bacterium]